MIVITTPTGDIGRQLLAQLLERAPARGEDLSPNDMAAIMSTVLGRAVHYERQSLEDLASSLTARGASPAFVAGMVDMMTAGSHGLHDHVVRTPGAAPTTFRQWCTDVLAPSVLADTTTTGGTR